MYNSNENVFRPRIEERMRQTDLAYRTILDAESRDRREKTRRLRLARQAMMENSEPQPDAPQTYM